jgi:hypothetical protein
MSINSRIDRILCICPVCLKEFSLMRAEYRERMKQMHYDGDICCSRKCGYKYKIARKVRA